MRLVLAVLLFAMLSAGCASPGPAGPGDLAVPPARAHVQATDDPQPYGSVKEVQATAAVPFVWTIHLDAPTRDLRANVWSEASAIAGVSVTVQDCGSVGFPVTSVGAGVDLGTAALCDGLPAGDHQVSVEANGLFTGRVSLSGD